MYTTTYIYMCMQIFVIFFNNIMTSSEHPLQRITAGNGFLFLLSFQTRRLNKGVSFKYH